MSYLDRQHNIGCLLGFAFILLFAIPTLIGFALADQCYPGPCLDKPTSMLIIVVGAPIVALLIAWITNSLIRRWRRD